VRRRLGDACQPGNHEPNPRHERNNHHAATNSATFRRALFDQDTYERWHDGMPSSRVH
jgi:hypothetical protein